MNLAYIFSNIGTREIILIVLVVILLFGAKKIPELMKGLGSGIKEFKDATKEEDKKPAENKNTTNTTENPQ